MPQIILKERTAHLASYTFLQEMMINIKTCQFHNCGNNQEHLCHRTLITSYFHPVIIVSFLEHLFYRTLPEAVVCRCSSK